MPNVSLNVKGLSELEKIPGWLEDGQRKFLIEVTDKLAGEFTAQSPKGRIPFHGHVVRSTEAKISSDHPGANALDKGAYFRGKRGQKLRFTVNGRRIFMKAVRLPARHYVKKALRRRNKIVNEVYDRYFNHLGGL